MATIEKVQAQIMKLQARADALVAKQSSGVIETIRDLMSKHGLTTADIDAHVGGKQRGAKTGGKKSAANNASTVYLDPKTGATWSGRGRAPAWISKVKDRSKFLVGGSTTKASVSAASKKKATGNYVRGSQPALYRDPQSGATWSGRGRAPAWLAGVKDRTRFLIEGASAATTETGAVNKASKPNTAGKSGAITKKTAAKKVVAKKAPAAKKVVATKKVAAKNASATKDMAPASKKVAARRAAAPTAKKVAVKKAPAKKAVVKTVVTKPDVVAAPASVTVRATT